MLLTAAVVGVVGIGIGAGADSLTLVDYSDHQAGQGCSNA